MVTPAFVHVVVGLIFNSHDQLLIAKRPDHLHQGGLWEFPGGKVEQNETAPAALIREFKEEVGIVVRQPHSFMEIYHQYADINVFLDIWISRHFDYDGGDGIVGLEGQQVRWVALTDLKNYPFPEANQEIINKLLSEKSHC